MKAINGGTQMRDVWTFLAIALWERSCGKHPTQKPLSVLSRIILSCTKPNDWIFDPFTGSSTTGIAANLFGRRFLGIDKSFDFLEMSKRRKLEIENDQMVDFYLGKINRQSNIERDIINESNLLSEPKRIYSAELPF